MLYLVCKRQERRVTHFLRPSHQWHCHVIFWEGWPYQDMGVQVPWCGRRGGLLFASVRSHAPKITANLWWFPSTLSGLDLSFHYNKFALWIPRWVSANRFVALVNLPCAQQFGSSIQRRQLLQVLRVGRIFDVKAWPVVVLWKLGQLVFECSSLIRSVFRFLKLSCSTGFQILRVLEILWVDRALKW